MFKGFRMRLDVVAFRALELGFQNHTSARNALTTHRQLAMNASACQEDS